MNEFVDMHVHSKFSIDGMSTMEDYCLIAGKTGTRVICFTEHVDFNSAEKNLSIVKDNRKQNFVVDDYFREINRLRKKYGSLTLLSGIPRNWLQSINRMFHMVLLVLHQLVSCRDSMLK